MIFAIDPGTTQSAYLLLDGKRIREFGIIPNLAMLQLLVQEQARLRVGVIAIECIQSYGNAVGSEIFETLIWIGRFAECASPRFPLWAVFRKQVVFHHARSVLAGDTRIRETMVERFGPKGTKANPGPTFGIVADCWSALAIASFVQDRIAGGGRPPAYGPFALHSIPNFGPPFLYKAA